MRLLSAGSLAALLFAIGMLLSWQVDRARLAAIAERVAPASLSDGAKAERLNAWVYGNGGFAKNRSTFIWSRLDATPIDVLERGGDCEDKSKLLVAMLDTVGVDASMAMQYPCRGCDPVHTVVLADVGDRWSAFDPVYDIAFPDGRGGYLDIEALRKQPALLDARLDALVATRGPADKIVKYSRRDHIFAHITTVNWDKNDATRAVAATLRAAGLDPAVTPRPLFLDNPKQFFAVASFALAVLLGMLALAVRRWPRRAAPDSRFAPAPAE